jgi:hypothetical protein
MSLATPSSAVALLESVGIRNKKLSVRLFSSVAPQALAVHHSIEQFPWIDAG